MPYKRKAYTQTRIANGGYYARTPKRARVAAKVVPGVTRTGGYYGRYAGAKAELKFHDLDIDDAVVAVNGTIAQASCNIIAQDTTEITRIGRKCTIKGIFWKYAINLPTAGDITSSADTVRVILYQDKQTNGGAATAALLMASDNFQSFRNLANSSRFTILLDRTHTINSLVGGGDGTANDTGPVRRDYSFSKLCNIPIEYDNSASTGALTTQRTNNIGVLLLGQAGKAGFESKMRLRFSDT